MFTFTGYEVLSTFIEVSQTAGIWAAAGLLAYGEYRVYKDRQLMADQMKDLMQYQALAKPKTAVVSPSAVQMEPNGHYR